jgi:hypothetical protein
VIIINKPVSTLPSNIFNDPSIPKEAREVLEQDTIGWLRKFDDLMEKAIIETLWEFKNVILADPDIPFGYKSALAVSVASEAGKIVLHVVLPAAADTQYVGQWRYSGNGEWTDQWSELRNARKKFGALDWELYKCPRRKYMGGTYMPSETLESKVNELWKAFKPKVKGLIVEKLQRMLG